MGGFRTRREDLPQSFPIFPLTGALLLPGGKLPLNIFEPRYLAMVEDSLAAGRLFGMIQPDPKGVAGPNGPALYRVGCLGWISAFSESDDGRYLITLTGLIRFSVVREVEMRRGYRRVLADYAAFEHDLGRTAEPERALAEGAPPRSTLISALHGYFDASVIEANWESIEGMPDLALVTTLSMACPFSAAEKQAILEAPDEAERASALLALLEINAHETPPN